MARSIEFDVTANDKATGKLRGVKEALNGLAMRLTGMFSASALFDRALGMAQQAATYFFNTLKDTAALADQAKAAGLTTDEYQRLAIAAKQAGLDQAGLMKGLKTMREFMRDARVEGSRQAEVLKALGYTQAEVTGGNIDAMDALMRLSGATEAAGSSQEKYNVLASVFGARAQELIPLLDGLRSTMANVADTPIFSADTIDQLDRAEKALQRIAQLQKVLMVQGGGKLLEMSPQVANTLMAGAGTVVGGALEAGKGFLNQPGKSIPVTADDKLAAEALGRLGAKAAAGAAGGSASISTAQSLGMATSLALAQQQTAYLATIAANTNPQMGAVIPGASNFTRPDATASELRDTYQRIKYGPSPTSKIRPAR